MANPRKENGFTAIPNELLEAVYSASFTSTELKIVLTVIRFTFGYSRAGADLSISFIANATGISHGFVAKCIRKLCLDKVLVIYKQATRNTPKQLGLNTDYDLWHQREGMVTEDYTGMVPEDYTLCEERVNTVCNRVAREYHTGVAAEDHQYININKNNKKKKIITDREYESEIIEVVEAFNSICKEYDPIVKINDRLADRILFLLDDLPMEEIKKAFKMAESSDYLTGRKNGWKAHFEWIIDSENMTKILNGSYGGGRPPNCSFDLEDFYETAVRASLKDE